MSPTTQHIIGIDLQRPVPTIVLGPAECTARPGRVYSQERIGDSAFDQDWNVFVARDQRESTSDIAGRLLTDAFIERLQRHDPILRHRYMLVLEAHHLLLTLPNSQNLEYVLPAADLLRDLAAGLGPTPQAGA